MVTKTSAPAFSLDNCRAYVAEHLFSAQQNILQLPADPWPGGVGMELEMLLVAPAQAKGAGARKNPSLVPLIDDGHGLLARMQELARRQGWQVIEETPSRLGHALPAKILTNENDYFTFEPGGQLELSTRPYLCLDELHQRIRAVQTLLDQEFAGHGWKILQLGINPWHGVEEIGLQLTKPRYRAMDKYFSSLSPYGQMMMRQTCSIQVALDFGTSESTLVERYLASQLLSPFATAIFANSPQISRKKIPVACQRALIWQHLDPTRSGFPDLQQIFAHPSREACSASYAEFLLAAPVVYIEALDFAVPEVPLSFAQWIRHGYRGVYPQREDFITHTSLHFPEVRPRGFLELRGVDCQARPWQMVPAAFFLGLLYDDQQRGKVLELLAPHYQELEAWRHDAQFGLQRASLAPTAKKLMRWAAEGLARLPACFRSAEIEKSFHTFARIFTERHSSPGQEILALLRRKGVLTRPRLATYQGLEDHWQQSLER